MTAIMQLDRPGNGTCSAGTGTHLPESAKSPLISTSRLPILPQCRPDPADCERMIREAAYFHAMQRGFAPGHELDDWLAAERELAQMLT